MAFMKRKHRAENVEEEAAVEVAERPIFLEAVAPEPVVVEEIIEEIIEDEEVEQEPTPIYDTVTATEEVAVTPLFLGSLKDSGIMQALPVRRAMGDKQKIEFIVPDSLKGRVCICQPVHFDDKNRDSNGYRVCPVCEQYPRDLVRGCLKCTTAFISNFSHPSFCRNYPLCWNCLEDLGPEGATCEGARHITGVRCGIGSEKIPGDPRLKVHKVTIVSGGDLDDLLDTMFVPSTKTLDFDF